MNMNIRSMTLVNTMIHISIKYSFFYPCSISVAEYTMNIYFRNSILHLTIGTGLFFMRNLVRSFDQL